jgi:dienelactone hydrolase
MSTVAARIDALSPHWRIFLPQDRPPPYPVCIQLHGCGGMKMFQQTWAEAAVRAGAAALIVDSHAHRGIGRLAAYSTVCTGLQLRAPERAGDLFAAMAFVRAQSWAARDKIIAAGWSHGGWTIMDGLCLANAAEMRAATGLTDLPAEPLEGLAAAFLVYPYCGPGSLSHRRRWRLAPRVAAIVGLKDTVSFAGAIRRALAHQSGYGASVTMTDLNVTHAFDEPDARDLRNQYDPIATSIAEGVYGNLIAAVRG